MNRTLTEESLILLTTSRRTTKDLRTLCRDLSDIFHNIFRVNRGKLSIEGIAEKASESNAGKVMVIDRCRGCLGKIQFFRVGQKGLIAVPPQLYLRGMKLGRDFEEKARARGAKARSVALVASPKPCLKSEKIETALSEFFDVPVLSLDTAISKKYDIVMQVSTESSNSATITFRLTPDLVEVGPRIRITNVIWELTK